MKIVSPYRYDTVLSGVSGCRRSEHQAVYAARDYPGTNKGNDH